MCDHTRSISSGVCRIPKGEKKKESQKASTHKLAGRKRDERVSDPEGGLLGTKQDVTWKPEIPTNPSARFAVIASTPSSPLVNYVTAQLPDHT
jgi:hypothetical protein